MANHELKGLFGIAYNCSNANVAYCDDWYTSKYKTVYGDNQNSKSLYHMKYIGIKHVRTYYLNPDLDHSDFLNLCDSLDISLEIGISNNLLDTRDSISIEKLVNSTKNHKCVRLYTIGNEYFNDPENIIWGIRLVGNLTSKYLMHSSIFDENFKSAKSIYLKVPDNLKPRYIVGINMYFYGNPEYQQGDVVQSVIRDYYNDSSLKDSYLIISEYGRNDDSYSAMWNFLWGQQAALKTYPKYLGVSLFSYSNESWKGSFNGENNYGLLTESGDKKSIYKAVFEFKKINP